MIEQLFFLLLAAGTIATSLMVVWPRTGRNPVYAALALVVSFFFMSGLYVLLLAHLMAVLQILVYAGAIMVLFMFVVMLLNLSPEELGGERKTVAKLVGGAAATFIGVKLVLVVSGSAAALPAVEVKATFGTVEAIGDQLFRQFLMPFELTSILLLAAVIGAVILAKRTL